MSVSKYSDYKESGVGWLGRIPSHWTLRRLGYYFGERREKVSDRDFPALSVTKNGVVPQLETAAKTDDGDNRKRVCVGDFVLNGRSDRKGSSGLSRLDGSVSLINIVLHPHKPIEMEFIGHLLRGVDFQEEFYRYGKGIVADLWSTNFSEMRNILLAIPPAAEQLSIASFLDRETGKIDALVAEQERLIALLKEKRQAVISQAVTKGLDPSMPKKESGVKWLREVPAHWMVVRVKACASLITSGPRGWSERIADHGAIFIQSGDLDEHLRVNVESAKRVDVEDNAEAVRSQLIEDDVVVCITGAKTGNVAVFGGCIEKAFINQHLSLVRLNGRVLPKFLGFALKGYPGQRHFEVSQYGLKQGLSLDDVKNAILALPPISEQHAIVERVQCEVSAIEALAAEAGNTIALLNERRAALISAAVTGKIDVRNLADNEQAIAA